MMRDSGTKGKWGRKRYNRKLKKRVAQEGNEEGVMTKGKE